MDQPRNQTARSIRRSIPHQPLEASFETSIANTPEEKIFEELKSPRCSFLGTLRVDKCSPLDRTTNPAPGLISKTSVHCPPLEAAVGTSMENSPESQMSGGEMSRSYCDGNSLDAQLSQKAIQEQKTKNMDKFQKENGEGAASSFSNYGHEENTFSETASYHPYCRNSSRLDQFQENGGQLLTNLDQKETMNKQGLLPDRRFSQEEWNFYRTAIFGPRQQNEAPKIKFQGKSGQELSLKNLHQHENENREQAAFLNMNYGQRDSQTASFDQQNDAHLIQFQKNEEPQISPHLTKQAEQPLMNLDQLVINKEQEASSSRCYGQRENSFCKTASFDSYHQYEKNPLQLQGKKGTSKTDPNQHENANRKPEARLTPNYLFHPFIQMPECNASTNEFDLRSSVNSQLLNEKWDRVPKNVLYSKFETHPKKSSLNESSMEGSSINSRFVGSNHLKFLEKESHLQSENEIEMPAFGDRYLGRYSRNASLEKDIYSTISPYATPKLLDDAGSFRSTFVYQGPMVSSCLPTFIDEKKASNPWMVKKCGGTSFAPFPQNERSDPATTEGSSCLPISINHPKFIDEIKASNTWMGGKCGGTSFAPFPQNERSDPATTDGNALNLTKMAMAQKKEIDALVKSYSERINRAHREIRSNSIRLFNVRELPDEDTKQVVQDMFRQVMKVDVELSDIQSCHRMPGSNGWKPIVVRFFSSRIKDKVMAQRIHLKGSRIKVEEELSHEMALLRRNATLMFGKQNVRINKGCVAVLLPDGGTVKFNSALEFDEFTRSSMFRFPDQHDLKDYGLMSRRL